MEEFALCIEHILLNRDQLLVPGLGSFVVQQLGARYDSREETFLPPMRFVRYDDMLQKHEDAVLLQALQRIYNIDLPAAQAKLDMWLTDFFQTLEDCGSVDLGCIGTFSQNEDGRLLFASSESGIVSPAFYALDTFHLKELDPQVQTEDTPHKVISNTERDIVIRLPHRIMKYVAAASVAVVMTLGLSIPVQNASRTQLSAQMQSSLFVPSNLSTLVQLPAPTNETPATATTAKAEATHSEKAEAPKTEQPVQVAKAETQPTTAPAPAKQENAAAQIVDNYCIVLASAISDKNATNYVEVLKQRGFVSARVLRGTKFNRVVVGRYATEEEARAAASDIQKMNKEYAGAWIFKSAGE